jgi:hypothetical protein
MSITAVLGPHRVDLTGVAGMSDLDIVLQQRGFFYDPSTDCYRFGGTGELFELDLVESC